MTPEDADQPERTPGAGEGFPEPEVAASEERTAVVPIPGGSVATTSSVATGEIDTLILDQAMLTAAC